MGWADLIYINRLIYKMTTYRKDIKRKIDEFDKEIKFLENKINEISWQRRKYQEFYKESIIAKTEH